MIVAELTVYYTRKGGYKNMTELNGLIYSDTKFKDYFDRYEITLKKRNQSKIRFESNVRSSNNQRKYCGNAGPGNIEVRSKKH